MFFQILLAILAAHLSHATPIPDISHTPINNHTRPAVSADPLCQSLTAADLEGMPGWPKLQEMVTQTLGKWDKVILLNYG